MDGTRCYPIENTCKSLRQIDDYYVLKLPERYDRSAGDQSCVLLFTIVSTCAQVDALVV